MKEPGGVLFPQVSNLNETNQKDSSVLWLNLQFL